MDRFGDEFELVALVDSALEDLGDAGLSGEEQDRTAWKILAECDGEFNSVHTRHEHVRNDPVRQKSGSFIECVKSVVGRNSVEPGICQNFSQRVRDEALIVDDEDLRPGILVLVRIRWLVARDFGRLCGFISSVETPDSGKGTRYRVRDGH